MTVTVSLPSTLSGISSPVSSPSALTAPSPLLADYIDPSTNDYLSIEDGMDPVDAQVIIAMKTKRGSGPSVTEDGHNLDSIKKIMPSVERDIEAQLKLALGRLIRNGDITYKGQTITNNDPANAYVEGYVSYVNERTFTGVVQTANFKFEI